MTRAISLAVLALLAAAPAAAQTRPNLPVVLVVRGSGNTSTVTPLPTTGDLYLPVYCGTGAGIQPPNAENRRCSAAGFSDTSAFTSVAEFARFSEVNALEARVAEIESSSFRDSLNNRADESAALAGALDLVSPQAGSANRIGAQAFTMGDRSAVGVTYTRASGAVDLGLGIASTGDRAAGKVGIGFSW